MDDGAHIFVASPAGSAESGPTCTIIHTNGSLKERRDKLLSLTDTHALHVLILLGLEQLVICLMIVKVTRK